MPHVCPARSPAGAHETLLPFAPTDNECWYLRLTAAWAERWTAGEEAGPEDAYTERDVSCARELLQLGPAIRLLETGCGWGRCTGALVRLGCTVTAFDLSPDMVALSRHHLAHGGLSATVRIATVRDIPTDGAPYDAIVGFRDDSPLSYETEALNLHTLRGLRSVLRPGGRLLFGTGDYPHDHMPLDMRSVRSSPVGDIVEHVTYAPATRWSVNRTWWPGNDAAPLPYVRRRKHYTPERLAVLLDQAGLRLLSCQSDFVTGLPYEAQPEGLVVLAERP